MTKIGLSSNGNYLFFREMCLVSISAFSHSRLPFSIQVQSKSIWNQIRYVECRLFGCKINWHLFSDLCEGVLLFISLFRLSHGHLLSQDHEFRCFEKIPFLYYHVLSRVMFWFMLDVCVIADLTPPREQAWSAQGSYKCL